jgi:DNA-binding MarR family transcriptional regulator
MRDSVPPALRDRLGPLLGRTHEAHRALTAAALAPLGLSPKGFGALAVLADEGPLAQLRLAERQGIDRTTMVAVIDELERAGAVERHRDPVDRRRYALHITAGGRALLARASTAVIESEDRFLDPLPATDRERLRAALRALLERGDPGVRRV